MRQATTAKVCLDLAKSPRFTGPVPSTVGFDRLLLTLSTIAVAQFGQRNDPAPKNSGNLTNVGSHLFFRTINGKYSGWR
jgi:hypothetical protein